MKTKFTSLSDAQQRSFGNGCGAAWMPKWLRELLQRYLFPYSCREHDFNGYVGGTIIDRWVRDLIFLIRMLETAANSLYEHKWLRALVQLIAAPVFYLLVLSVNWARTDYGRIKSISEILALDAHAKNNPTGRIVSEGWYATRLLDLFFVIAFWQYLII